MKVAIADSPMSQTEIATRVGASQATVSRWAQAEASPDRRLWPAIRDILGVDLASIRPDRPFDSAQAMSQLEIRTAAAEDNLTQLHQWVLVIAARLGLTVRDLDAAGLPSSNATPAARARRR